MEFIFVVLMFAVCASICVGVFARADYMSRLATATNESILIAETAIEEIKGLDSTDKDKLEKEIKNIENNLNEKHSDKYSIKINYEVSHDIIVGNCRVESPLFGKVCELPLAKYVSEV